MKRRGAAKLSLRIAYSEEEDGGPIRLTCEGTVVDAEQARARDFIVDYLSGRGEVARKDLMAAGRDAGFSERTLDRAIKCSTGVIQRPRRGFYRLAPDLDYRDSPDPSLELLDGTTINTWRKLGGNSRLAETWRNTWRKECEEEMRPTRLSVARKCSRIPEASTSQRLAGWRYVGGGFYEGPFRHSANVYRGETLAESVSRSEVKRLCPTVKGSCRTAGLAQSSLGLGAKAGCGLLTGCHPLYRIAICSPALSNNSTSRGTKRMRRAFFG